MDPSRPDIALQVSKLAFNSDSESEDDALSSDTQDEAGERHQDSTISIARSQNAEPKDTSAVQSILPSIYKLLDPPNGQRRTKSQSLSGWPQAGKPRKKKKSSIDDEGSVRSTPAGLGQLEPKSKRTEDAAENYIISQRGLRDTHTEKAPQAAKRASGRPSRPSTYDILRSQGKNQSSQSDSTVITNVDSKGEIRFRVDGSAPISLSFNGDMEGRTLQIEPAENGMADIIIGSSRGEESTYRSDTDSVLSKSRKPVMIHQNRREAEEQSERSSRSSQRRREGGPNENESQVPKPSMTSRTVTRAARAKKTSSYPSGPEVSFPPPQTVTVAPQTVTVPPPQGERPDLTPSRRSASQHQPTQPHLRSSPKARQRSKIYHAYSSGTYQARMAPTSSSQTHVAQYPQILPPYSEASESDSGSDRPPSPALRSYMVRRHEQPISPESGGEQNRLLMQSKREMAEAREREERQTGFRQHLPKYRDPHHGDQTISISNSAIRRKEIVKDQPQGDPIATPPTRPISARGPSYSPPSARQPSCSHENSFAAPPIGGDVSSLNNPFVPAPLRQSSPVPVDTRKSAIESPADLSAPTVLRCDVESCDAMYLGVDRKGELARHKRQNHHGSYPQYPCEDDDCDLIYLRLDARLAHYKRDHPHLALGFSSRLRRLSSSMSLSSAANAETDGPSNENRKSDRQQETQPSVDHKVSPLLLSKDGPRDSKSQVKYSPPSFALGPTTPPIAEVATDEFDWGANVTVKWVYGTHFNEISSISSEHVTAPSKLDILADSAAMLSPIERAQPALSTYPERSSVRSFETETTDDEHRDKKPKLSKQSLPTINGSYPAQQPMYVSGRSKRKMPTREKVPKEPLHFNVTNVTKGRPNLLHPHSSKDKEAAGTGGKKSKMHKGYIDPATNVDLDDISNHRWQLRNKLSFENIEVPPTEYPASSGSYIVPNNNTERELSDGTVADFTSCGNRIELELNNSGGPGNDIPQQIIPDEKDSISVVSSYAESIDSIFSVESLASSASILSKASGYSATQIATATKVLLSIFHDDKVLLPLYRTAINNPNIGPERLERNLRRLFKAYAEHLGSEATERLEYLASRLVLVKSRSLARSIIDKYKSDPVSPQASRGEHSDDEEVDETDTRVVNEDAFEDLVAFREFLVGSEAFRILYAQIEAFVIPKPPHLAMVEAISEADLKSAKHSLTRLTARDRSTVKDWQHWLVDVKQNVDAVFCDTNLLFFMTISIYLAIDALFLITDDLLITAGQLEPSLREGQVRLRWQCRCGDSLHSDVEEIREGGVAELIAHMHRTSGVKICATPYNQVSGNQRYISPRPAQWVQNSVTKLTAFGRSSKPASCLPQHNTSCPTTACSATSNNPSRQQTLHLLACMHRNQSRKVLQQDRIEDVTTDRTLLCFLRQQYIRHRGRFLRMISLKSVKGIFFVKFRLPIGGSVDVRHHNPCCMPTPTACECIPPPPKVEPSPTAEYRCIPGPPATYPPIPPEYLSSLFTCPSDVHEDDTWILDQLPKRTCGELQGKIGQPAEGWGIYYQEGWDRDMITLLVFLIFMLASLLFGILWSRFQFDVQGAFGVSAYMVAASSILVTLITTRAEKMG